MKINKLSILNLYILLFGLAILNGYFFDYLNNVFFHFNVNASGMEKLTPVFKFSVIVFIAPVIETFLLQYVPNIILLKIGVKNRFFLILIPAIIFGSLHLYFWLYMLMALFGGVLINTLYVYAKERNSNYIIIVISYHSLYNLFGYLFVN